MNNTTAEKIAQYKQNVEDGIDFMLKYEDRYSTFKVTMQLGYYLSLIDTYLMTDKIEYDEYTILRDWFSLKSSDILRLAMAFDNKYKRKE